MTDPINELAWLQAWYAAQCNGDWEHGYGVRIATLDNPGWSIRIELAETALENEEFAEIKVDRSDRDWISCRRAGFTFEAYGGANNLVELIRVFRVWATSRTASHTLDNFIKHRD